MTVAGYKHFGNPWIRFVKSQVRTISSATLNVVSELDGSRNTSLYRQATLTCAGACTTRRPGKAL